MTNKDRADSILINMSKAELVKTGRRNFTPHALLRELRGYTKRDLRALVVRWISFSRFPAPGKRLAPERH